MGMGMGLPRNLAFNHPGGAHLCSGIHHPGSALRVWPFSPAMGHASLFLAQRKQAADKVGGAQARQHWHKLMSCVGLLNIVECHAPCDTLDGYIQNDSPPPHQGMAIWSAVSIGMRLDR